MSSASVFVSVLINTPERKQREKMYQEAERDYGKNFAEHLRDQIEAHHLIVENERAINAAR